MALEDFFTLTEMRDGLSSTARVEDLISVIQNARECPTNYVNETIRQWSTVASTLAATKHEECLSHFVKLNVVSFLEKWLQEATDPDTVNRGINAEEIIIALLSSLEKLPVDGELLMASGTGVTIKQLLDYENHQIKEKARILLDKWNCGVDNAIDGDDAKEENNVDLPGNCEQSKSNENDGSSGTLGARINSCNGESYEENQSREWTSTKCNHQSVTGRSEGIHQEFTSNQVQSSTSANSDTASLEASNPQSPYPVLDSSVCSCNRVGSQEHPCLQSDKGKCCEKQGEVPFLDNTFDTIEEMNVGMLGDKEANDGQGETRCNSSTSIVPVSETFYTDDVEPAISCEDLASKKKCSLSKSVHPNSKTQMIENDKLMPETNNVSKLVASISKGFEDSHATMSNVGAETHQKNMFARSDGYLRDHNSPSDPKASQFDSITTDSLSIAENKVIDLEHKPKLELASVDDALEVARLVALQVEREVVDYREPFCSSPDVNSGEIAGASSSEERKCDRLVVQESLGANSCKVEQHEDSSKSKESSEITDNLCSDPKNHDEDVVKSQILNNSPIKEPTAKTENDKYFFDLNVDICNVEPEYLKSMPDEPVNVAAPIAVVGSARGAPSLPVTPAHSEDEGWKGSAATSAFQPAASCRTPDSERAVSSTKKKTNRIDIDLNIAECCNELIEPKSVKPFPAFSSFPSESSSVDIPSKKVERLNLDLNRAGDEDVLIYPSGLFRHQQNGEHSLSSAASNSRCQSPRNFDLNDNPTFMDGDSSQNFSSSFSKVSVLSVGSKLEDPVSMIMGSKMAAERKDSHMQFFLPDELSMEHAAAFSKPLMPYPTTGGPFAYGYNGLPAGSTMSGPQAFYSPSSIPYVVDARTRTVTPQMFSAGGPNAAVSVRPPFVMSVPAGPSHANLYGSFHPGFDLNSGVMFLDVGAKHGNFTQLFLQGQNGLMQEPMNATPLPSSSGGTLKRKEPETGWELHPCGYKQVTK